MRGKVSLLLIVATITNLVTSALPSQDSIHQENILPLDVHAALHIATTQSTHSTTKSSKHIPCVFRILQTTPSPAKSSLYITIATEAANTISKYPTASRNSNNITREAVFVRTIFNQHTRIFAIAITSPEHPNLLAYRKRDRLLIHRNRTVETEPFWQAIEYTKFNSSAVHSRNYVDDVHGAGNLWSPPFRDCLLNRGNWYQGYIATTKSRLHSVTVFVPVSLNQCDSLQADIFGGTHKCDPTSTKCIPKIEYGLKQGGYKCVCRERYYYPHSNHTWSGFSGEDVENELVSPRCLECPETCDRCDRNGQCMAQPDFVVRSIIIVIQIVCMLVTITIAFTIFRQRKCKVISTGMWTILEMILLGIFFLYATVIVRFFEPSVERCVIEAWARELGFIICYGSIVLKLYRHLIDFRTRKAHRWIVKDTDLLKYLFVMFAAVFAYMSAYTASCLDFIRETNYSILLLTSSTPDGMHFLICKPMWWDYVTQFAEILILVFGVHLSYASRNAATQFQERFFLCAAVSMELLVSGVFYVLRPVYLTFIHPDHEYFAYFLRSQLTSTVVLGLVFIPKFWYQHKQSRSLGQEFSCRVPVDAFKPDSCNTHGPLMSNNSSDIEVSEITIANMNPEDIRAELKRLYTQLEVLRNKTIRQNNPHISKRRGGRKVAHRRFSLQALHGKHHRSHKHQQSSEVEVTEGEMSRTPEDSVCSGEGPSAIYNDLASTYSELIGPPNAAALIKPPQTSQI